MTRRIDRVHELRRRDEPVMATERQGGVDAVAAADLHELLGIPVGMRLTYSAAPAPTNDDVTLRCPWCGRAEFHEHDGRLYPDGATAAPE